MLPFFVFIFFILKSEKVLGYRCDYGGCSCVDDMVTCVDVTGPYFKFRATVSMLYMDNVQIINLVDILKKLPNLRYLTLMNMSYFDCEWIKDLPKQIYLKTNMCSKSSTTKRFQNHEFLTASESLAEGNDKTSTEVYEKSSTVLPLQTSTFSPVSSKEISYFSQEVHSNTPSKVEFSTSGRNPARNEVKSPFKKNKWRKFLWIISVAVCLAVILFTIIAIIICKRKQRGRRQITDSDNTMLALSENLGMEESSLDCSK